MVMINKKHDYKILWNMPYHDLISQWGKDKNDLRNKDLYYWRDELETRPWKSVGMKPDHPVHKIVEEKFSAYGLTLGPTQYMITVVGVGMDSLHLDPPIRGAAINIPIEIEKDWQFFLTGSAEDLTEAPRTASNAVKFYYEPEKCSFFNCRAPWIFNSQAPHSFANYAKTDRVVMSISFLEDYDTVLKLIPKEWF